MCHGRHQMICACARVGCMTLCTCGAAQACSNLDVDIIAMDVSRRLPFRLKPATLQAAVKRGIHFEVFNVCGLKFKYKLILHVRHSTDRCQEGGIASEMLNPEPIISEAYTITDVVVMKHAAFASTSTHPIPTRPLDSTRRF